MRTLNTEEMAIVAKKEKRMGKKLDVVGIEYRKAFPRSTICIINRGIEYMHTSDEENNQDPLASMVIGIAMRAKNEPDIPANGRVTAFIRALESI